MPFCPSKNFIFTHITKTAGSSFNKVFTTTFGAHDYLLTGHVNHEINYFVGFKNYQDLEHLTVQQQSKILGPKRFNDCFKFTFVRNPWDRLVSNYFWKQNDPWANKKVKEYVNTHSFEQYILEGIAPLAVPMHQWVTDSNKKVVVDFVGRYENLHDDFSKVCQKINIKTPELPQVYKTNHKPYKDYYSQATIDKVASVYKDDIEIFGYDY